MSPEQFLLFADVLPEPALLVGGDGLIHAANRAVEDRLGRPASGLIGGRLADLAADPPDAVAEYLQACSRTRSPVLGSLAVKAGGGDPLRCRCDGAVVRPDPDPAEARVFLRLTPAASQFAALNQKIEELNGEVRHRRRVEEELRRERELLQVTLTSVGDALVTTDTDGRVTFLNRVAERLTGWTAADAAGRDLREVFPIFNEETGEAVENPVASVLRDGRVVSLANHTVLRARGGAERPVADSAAPIRDDAGRLAGVVLVFRDVSAERDAQEALRQRERHLRAVIDATPECVKLVAPDGRLVEMNAAGLAMVEADPGRPVLGGCVYDVIAPEFRAAFRRFNEEVCRGEPGSLEFDLVGLKGTRRHMETHAVPLPTPDGTYHLAVTRDITDRRRAEQALRESEERFRLLAETIPQLAWTARPDGHIYWYNRRWYEYTGTTPERMEGWGWQSVHDPAELPRVVERWAASLATGEPFDMVFPLRGRDGVFRPFLTRVEPFRGADGRILQWFGTNTDVSEIKAMEDALRDADRRKDEFLAMLAHELRNPLAPIRNALQLLQMPGVTAATAGKARSMMERQVQHLVRLVDDLMDVSRIMRGKIELRTGPVELAGVVARAVEIARPAVDAGGHDLAVDLPAGPVVLDADAVRLAQVFANLLANAARYTETAGRIRLTAERLGGEVVVRVADTGVGIAPDVLPRVFDPFFQAERTHKHPQGGLGVGLTLVKRLVELHGGTADAYSDGPGRGSEFVVRLPVAALAGDPVRPAAGEPGPGGTTRLRVLVVDDNVDAADSLAMVLRAWGHDVRTAHDGPTALDVVGHFQADVVLLDIGMPGMTGHDVARRLRERPEYRTAFLAAMTGYGADDDRRRSREAGMDRHLVKPVEPDALLRLLADARPSTTADAGRA